MNNLTPTLFIKRLSILTLVTLTSCVSFAQDSLDSFLSTPIPASPIPAEIARKTVDKANSLAASAASRRNEITAYLIPFQRVLGVPAEAKAAPVSTIVPRPKPFLIFKSSDGVAEFFKASTVSTQGEFIIAQSTEGKKGMWQKNRFATQLPWYFDEEMESGSIDLTTLGLRYKVLETTFPALKNIFQSEMERIQKVNRKFTEAADLKKLKLTETATRIIAQAQSYTPDHAYTREELARILLEAEEARRSCTSVEALHIDKAMEPFRTHFENLLAANVYLDGRWQAQSVVDQNKALKNAADEAQAFEKNLRIELKAQTVSKSGIQSLLTGLGIVAVVIFVAGLYLLIGKTPVRAAGVLLCLTPATLWIYGNSKLSAPYPSAPSFRAEKPEGTNNVLRVLYLASGGGGSAPVSEVDRRITLRESDLNSFVKEYVKFADSPSQPESGLYRTDLAFQLLPGEVIIWELSQYKGRPLRIRYDFKIEGIGPRRTGGEAGMKIADFNVAIGNLTLPGFLGKQMLGNLTEELITAARGVFQAYKVTRLSDGEADLTSINSRREASAGAAQAPATPAAAPEEPANSPAITIEPVPSATPPDATPTPETGATGETPGIVIQEAVPAVPSR